MQVSQVSTKANGTDTPVRGALDEKHEIYSKAVALEEKTEEDETPVDLEGNLAPRPAHRIHAFKISFAIMLVILTQSLGVSRVSLIIAAPGLQPDTSLMFLPVSQ